MTRLFWTALFLAAGFANSIPDAWLPPLPIMVAAFMACIGLVGWFMNRANRNCTILYSGTIQMGRYKDAGFPARLSGGVR